MISVWVSGVPKTKGSMEQQQHPRTCRCRTCSTGRRGYRMVQSVEGSEQWAALVARAVADSVALSPAAGVGHLPMGGSVAVRLAFWLPGDPIAPRAGDVDKLARNVLDALTKAGAYGDDVQVVRMICDKYGPAPAPGLLVQVWPHVPDTADATVQLMAYQMRVNQGLTN